MMTILVKHYNRSTKIIHQKSYTKIKKVEATGVEPVSKHILQKLSTCLFLYCLSAMIRERTNQIKA